VLGTEEEVLAPPGLLEGTCLFNLPVFRGRSKRLSFVDIIHWTYFPFNLTIQSIFPFLCFAGITNTLGSEYFLFLKTTAVIFALLRSHLTHKPSPGPLQLFTELSKVREIV
jgi:hypothetical protein